MQTLSPQYSTLLTRKFRVYYSDFIQDSATRKSLLLFTLPRNWEMLTTKIWLRQTFAAASLTTATCYVINGSDLALASESARSPITQNLLLTATDYSGSVSSSTHPISEQSADNDFYLRIVTNSISGGAVFTAGYFDIWIITCRMP